VVSVLVRLAPSTDRSAGRALRGLRWYVCGLLFLVTLINYVDRQTVGALGPLLRQEIGWDDAGFGWINFAFSLAYAMAIGVSGRLLDRVGVKVGLAWAVTVWSVAAVSHALARGVVGFAVARFALGLGEAANYPGCIKATAEWFPRRERALATGIFNSGANFGIMLSPGIVLLATSFGWRAAFVVTGALGFLWVGWWTTFYQPPSAHPSLGEQERALILEDADGPGSLHVPWTSLLRYRQAWAFALGKMLTDPVWWFYMFWLPTYLTRERGETTLHASVMLLWPYLAADLGSIGGGWVSGHLIKRGWPVGRARLGAMALFALCMPAAILAAFARSFALTLGLISLAMAAHQAWSANLFTMASDMFPRRVVGSVVGLGQTAGAIGAMLMTLLVGGFLQATRDYVPIFVLAGLLHPLALLLIHLLVGARMPEANLDPRVADAPSGALRTVGTVVVLAGGGMLGAVCLSWRLLAARSISVAPQGLVVSLAVSLVGVALLHASRPGRGVQKRSHR
jgi:ACS family hexuronate transporter-like MFS transporter